MANLMKDTKCLKCGKDLNSVSYEKMMAHIAQHKRNEESWHTQKGMDEFT